MYESPVNIIYGEMQTQIEGDVFKAIQNVGIDFDKDKLIKALQYDRGQYEKGYKDGYKKAIDDFVKLVNECSGYTENCIEHDLCLTVYTIHQITEQLKGGAE